MTAAVWLACALCSGLLGGIVWAGWRHVPGDRAFMLALASIMGAVSVWRFLEAVAGHGP